MEEESSKLIDKIDYLTSSRILFSDKYKIWRWDPLIFLLGFFLALFGLSDYYQDGYYRLFEISLGALMVVLASIRIERRYSKLKEEIRSEIRQLTQKR